ncbi:MAG: hypothetical protein HC781_06480 [Leptolyngbyaceae cyanobacterium CSU_1_4]|nr:hypothetical protein [Leptolyngbyaceae cyanobacterium CSU_1_4]
MPKHASTPTGELALILGFAVRDKNATLLQQSLRELGLACSEAQAKWAIAQAKADMTAAQKDWLEAHLRQLYHDPENQRKLPVYSYLWQAKESLSLDAEMHTRTTTPEKERFLAIARDEGISSSELLRDIVRTYLAERSCTQQPGNN